MEWHDLLFAHWPLPPELLRPLIPPRLTLETYGGSAWVGIVPFRMAGVRPRLAPRVPWLSAFAELNVRTYVTDGVRPGVWFFSLDAANPVAVELARLGFHLPYFDATMTCAAAGDSVVYTSRRTHRGARAARLTARYRPTGAVALSVPGSLESWLTERYALYAANASGTVWRGEIHHQPWPLQPAEARFDDLAMLAQIGLPEPSAPPLLHFARRLDVVAWLPERLSAMRGIGGAAPEIPPFLS